MGDQPELKKAERPYLSFSRLGTFGRCPTSYRLKYVEQSTPRVPQGALLGGSAIHEAIELAEAKELWATDEAMEEACDRFRQLFYEAVEEEGGPRAVRWGGRKTKEWPEGETHHWWMANGPSLMLRTYARVRRADVEAGVLKVEHAEAEVLTELPGVLAPDGGPVMIKGYIDLQVLTTEDGELVVRDWKSGSSNAEPIQLASYCWQLQQAGSRPTVGEFVYVRRPQLSNAVHRHDVAELIPLVPRFYADLAAMILVAQEAEAYPMQPSSFCIACDVRLSCPYGQTLGPPPERWGKADEEAGAMAAAAQQFGLPEGDGG